MCRPWRVERDLPLMPKHHAPDQRKPEGRQTGHSLNYRLALPVWDGVPATTQESALRTPATELRQVWHAFEPGFKRLCLEQHAPTRRATAARRV